VDGHRVEEDTDYGTARLLDVSSARLYVGGVGVAGRAAAVDARLVSLLGPDRAAAGSLLGACVRNFKVDVTFTSSGTFHRRRRLYFCRYSNTQTHRLHLDQLFRVYILFVQ